MRSRVRASPPSSSVPKREAIYSLQEAPLRETNSRLARAADRRANGRPVREPGLIRRMQFDRHTLVLLLRRPDAPEITDEEAAELQDRHLAFRADLRDRGYLIGGGPLVDQDDERLRGISIKMSDTETARRLSNEDPAVRAGRLAVEVMTWMVPAGNVRFENVPAPRSMAEAAED